jgi:hypothetical protein
VCVRVCANKRNKFLLITGNKVDKDGDREVPTRIGSAFAEGNGFEYFIEASALNATNVDTLFSDVAARLTTDLKAEESRCVVVFYVFRFILISFLQCLDYIF